MNKSSKSRSTPEPIKHILRKEAGFGCCKCGLPIYQYHHILEYAEEQHFRAEDMMILCPTHHYEATLGAMTKVEQRSLKSNPYNVKNGYTVGNLKINQKDCIIAFGEWEIAGDGGLFQVDEEVLLGLNISEDGFLELSLNLYDSDDNLLLSIIKNEWISGDVLLWDIESSFQKLKIRRNIGDIILSINTQTEPIEIRADLWRKKHSIKLTKKGIEARSLLKGKSGSVRNISFAGAKIVADTLKNSLVITKDPRFPNFSLHTDRDDIKRRQAAIQSWKKLISEYNSRIKMKGVKNLVSLLDLGQTGSIK